MSMRYVDGHVLSGCDFYYEVPGSLGTVCVVFTVLFQNSPGDELLRNLPTSVGSTNAVEKKKKKKYLPLVGFIQHPFKHKVFLRLRSYALHRHQYMVNHDISANIIILNFVLKALKIRSFLQNRCGNLHRSHEGSSIPVCSSGLTLETVVLCVSTLSEKTAHPMSMSCTSHTTASTNAPLLSL